MATKELLLAQNFEAILESSSFTDADRSQIANPNNAYSFKFSIAKITFGEAIKALKNELSVDKNEDLKLVEEIFEEYCNRDPNRSFAEVFLKYRCVQYSNTLQPHFSTDFNQNLIKSLTRSSLLKISSTLQCFTEELCLGNWCPWGNNSESSYSFEVVIQRNWTGSASDDQTVQQFVQMGREKEVFNLLRQRKQNLRLRCKLNICALLKDTSEPTVPETNNLVQPLKLTEYSILLEMFGNEETKDFKIIVRDGIEIKAHKCVLAAHSNVFETMMSSKMKEGESGSVQIGDIGEAAMRHLVRYFYGMEIRTLDLNCETACDLFQSAHKYKLKKLEDSMISVFLFRDEKWFTEDTALELYFYTKNISEAQNVHNHLLQVLSRIPSEKLRAAATFLELATSDVVDLAFKLTDVLRSQLQ